MRGLYTVKLNSGIYSAKASGLFRKADISPIVGDMVQVRMPPDEDMVYIEKILPRKNRLLRPPVANVDRVLIVMSQKEPNIQLTLLDRFLIMCEQACLVPILCLNKADKADRIETDRIAKTYRKIGYRVLITSAETGEGLDELRSVLSLGTTVLGGPSGVGKSTLLMCLYPELELTTGRISDKTQRGKHTTRHVEIYPIGGNAYVLDTPGFSQLDLSFIKESEDLELYFPEFVRGSCRFDNCQHYQEPKCHIKKLVRIGEIARHRYDNYLLFQAEVKERRSF